MKTLKIIENERKIYPLSAKQIEMIAWLEFYKKYFFAIKDIQHFFRNKKQRYNIIQRLLEKRRIAKLNKNEYYLIPIKAKNGNWTEDPFILADEIMNGEDYFIGGWAAANYWGLTDQIPFKIEVFTTKRQGTKTILNTEFIFRRTTSEKIKRAIVREINGHPFRIMNKREMRRWVKSRS